MNKENKPINNFMKLFIQVILLSILGIFLVFGYYRSEQTKHTIHMSENFQHIFSRARNEIYGNYSLIKAVSHDLEALDDFQEDDVNSMFKEYTSRNSQIKKLTLADSDGKIIYVSNNSGDNITNKYKGLPIGASLVKTAPDILISNSEVEMKHSIYSSQDFDLILPVYKDTKLSGFCSITVDAGDMFAGIAFNNILKKNEIAVNNLDESTVFESSGFSGKNTYVNRMNIEDIEWIIQIESKENVRGNIIKNTVLVALGFLLILFIVIYLQWKILNRSDYIKELKRLQEEIQTIAYTDSLTGLYNRRSITDQIKDYIKNSKEKDICAIIFLDLDNFKNINDVFGHDKGDMFLISISKVFKKISHRDHRIVTSRIGGDEFIVLFKDINSEDEVRFFCNEVLKKISNISSTNNDEFNISASMGVSFFPTSGRDIETLFKNSDMAMYHSKEMGKNQYSFFDDEMGKQMLRRTLIESRLRTLINNNDFSSFSLVYQPQVQISNNSDVKRAEALLRWNDEELGFVSPVEFIGIAESTGTIEALGAWVLRETCKYLKVLETKLEIKQNISVNISPKQFRITNFVENMINIVNEEGVCPSQITMEITEQVFIDDMIDCIKILDRLKSVGFQISLDDFGTGYSSLSYLNQLPIDVLKIDKSFVDNIELDAHSLDLIEGIFQLSSSIHLNVIVEGVETNGQFRLLKDKGVETIQGYYFSKPLSPEDYILFSQSELEIK